MRKMQTKFLKGINRRFSREESADPDSFYSLQNARLFTRGDTGQIKRMKGFDSFGNNKDYSNVLDINTYENLFIVFFKVSTGNFGVDIYDKDGVLQDSVTYSGTDTDSGEVIVSNQSIFLTPHNKVLYYNQGNWQLEDYISSVPQITDISKQNNGSVFSATIDITSGASTRAGKRAFTKVTVNKNNIPSGKSDIFKVQITGSSYSKESVDATIDYTDTRKQIADKLKTAINDASSTITDDWEVLDSFSGESTSDRAFFIVAKTAGTTWNGYSVTVSGSEYNIINEDNITERPERSGREGSRVDELRYEEEYRDWQEDKEYDRVNSTLLVYETSGGKDAESSHDVVTVVFSDKDIQEETTNIVDTDTATDIATKIQNALSEVRDYSVSKPTTSSVKITADKAGKLFNTDIKLVVDGEKVSDIFSHNITTNNGTDSSTFSGLGSYEDYWYKVRYRYLDGHVTSTSFAVYTDSGANDNIEITISNSDFDIDGNRPKIELFRKTSEGEFFQIDSFIPDSDPYVYIDDGKTENVPLDDRTNIWTKKYESQEIVENRLVRANIDYFSEDYNWTTDFGVSLVNSSDNFVLPSRQKTRVYLRPQYTDGSLGFHKEAGSVNVEDFGKKLQIQQNSLVENTNKDISSLGFYIDLSSFGEFDSMTFRSLELNNQNLPAIGDQGYFPINTRIFFGLKYIKIRPADSGYYVVSNVGTWNSFEGDSSLDEEAVIGTIDNSSRPDQLEYLNWNYIKVKERAGSDEAVYKLDTTEALKQAVLTEELYIKINQKGLGGVDRVRGPEQPSGRIISDSDVLEAEVKVNSVIDNTIAISVNDDGNLMLPNDNRLYLSLDESVYDDIDAPVNNYGIERNYNSGGPSSFRLYNDLIKGNLSFRLLGFNRDTEPTKDDTRTDNSGAVTTTNIVWDEPVYDLNAKNRLGSLDELIYIGKKDNDTTTKTFEITGFEDQEDDNLNYAFLNDFNFYESLIKRDDINVNRSEYPTQLMWSDPLTDDRLYSGGRNMRLESFLSITENRGQIQKIVYIYGSLYVFCETGVAKVNVGEIVSQQKGGEMFVNSSTFLTDYVWVIDSLKDIKKESIVKYENAVYFSDGFDVFRITNQIERLTSGNIDLDPDHSYTAFVNNKQKEYTLCDLTDGVSWSYNIEFKQWTGPHSFICQKGSYVSNTTVTGFGDDLVEHDIGNTFNGTPYDTVIQSVASDQQQSMLDKNFRKFYINTENDTNAVFKYGKDYNSMVSENINSMYVKNGYKHQGVQPSEQNSKHIYWDIVASNQGFTLKELAYAFRTKKRR